jgi:hypothetical protein
MNIINGSAGVVIILSLFWISALMIAAESGFFNRRMPAHRVIEKPEDIRARYKRSWE